MKINTFISVAVLITAVLCFTGFINSAKADSNPCPNGIGTPCGSDNCCHGSEVCNPFDYSCCAPGSICGNNPCCPQGSACCPHVCLQKSSNHNCNGPESCTTLLDDPSNCGACGNTCPSEDQCKNGKCVAVDASFFCPAGQVICVPGSSSPVTNLLATCGITNAGKCYCADTCGQTCSGCSENSLCLSIGTRVSGSYCSLDKTMLSQKNNNETCDNSFECKSNFCSGTCISASLMQKIINWFKNLFGAI